MNEDEKLRKTEEWRTWLFLTIVLAPAVAVAIVGSYGFAVWILQLFSGPPTY
jgi:nitrate reductase NapE